MKKRRIAVALISLVFLWVAGLFFFADRVIDSTPAEEPEDKADAIVALTGASDMRIREGMRLLERRKGERLLISGVNKEVRRPELLPVTDGSKRLYDCCVDLGFDAVDTVGNAAEIAAWARAKSYNDLIVVTSDYHMPRSLLEIKQALPEATLHPYPVATPSLDARAWWKSTSGSRVLVIEYCKYLAILGRNLVGSVASLFDKNDAAGKSADSKADDSQTSSSESAKK